jgi:hypothetical protein
MEMRARTVRSCLNPYNHPPAMPVLSHELLVTGVEMVCYFCTAIGVAFAFLFGVRA